MRRLALIVAIATSLVGSSLAQPNSTADTVRIATRDGDSYGLLAAEYYGDRKHAMFIVVENNIKQPKPLRPGTRLRIPVAREIVTSPKDTFATLAETYLDSARRGADLAAFNNMKDDESPAAGTLLVIPFVVTYTPQAPESLTKIAATYLGSSKHAQLLSNYNSLDGALEVDKGQAIAIPAFNVKMQASKMKPLDEKSKERRDQQRTIQKQANEALPRARHAWRIGDFATVKKQLEGLDTDFLEQTIAIEVGVLLGSAHVAFGNNDDAKTAFARVLDRKPSHDLGAFEHSPKVLAVWKQAVGEAQ